LGKVVGIDLGTGFSALALVEGKEAKVIINQEGSKLTPSIVAFTDSGERLVGRQARSQAVTNPTRTVFGVKRFMGRTRAETKLEEKMVPYAIVGNENELVQIEIDGKRYYPPEISAMVLQDLKRSAEAYLGEHVKDAVITCPAYFNDAQRQATKEAGKIAGFNVLRILNEPTAAALAYGFETGKDQVVSICDFGSGTWDVTLVHISDGVFSVLSTNGDTQLGGNDLDYALTNWISDEFKKSSGFDIRTDPMALQRLTEAAEKAKCDLSSVQQTTINLPYITAVGGVPKHLTQTVTRAKFEQICEPILNRLKGPIEQALRDAKLLPEQVNEVVLVGGSTRMPKVQELCKQVFGGKEPHRGCNPDEAVAIGAAIQAAVLTDNADQQITGIVLLDVTPLSLGVETLGGIMDVVVPRNTTIPHRMTRKYCTAADNQIAVDVHVLQGERRFTKDNRTLGRFQLTGLSPLPRGQCEIEVAFDIDANGILNVSATNANTGKVQKVEIKSSSGLDKSQVDRMVKEAKENEGEEKERFELVEARNKADNLMYQTEKFMRDNSAKLSAATHTATKASIDTLKGLLDKNAEKNVILAAMDAVEIANKNMDKEVFDYKPKPTGPQGQGPVFDGDDFKTP
jgi:molecular chaperone DnaK